MDLLIEASAANAKRLLAAMNHLGFLFASELRPEDLARRPITVIGDLFCRLDVLTVAWSVRYAEARAEARVFDVEGGRNARDGSRTPRTSKRWS